MNLDDLVAAYEGAHSLRQRIGAVRQVLKQAVISGSLEECLGALTALAERTAMPLSELRWVCYYLAWDCRDEAVPTLPPGHESDVRNLIQSYLHLQRLQYDFRFAEIATTSTALLEVYPDDGLLVAFRAFASCGLRTPNAASQVESALRRPDVDRTCRLTLLQALWFGVHLSDQAERMLALSDEMIERREDGANCYYWRAYALRRLHRQDEALASIDDAIEQLSPDQISIHQDFVREREAIVTSLLWDRDLDDASVRIERDLRTSLSASLEQAHLSLTERGAEAQRLVRESLTGLVEILGLFFALMVFLLGGGYIAFHSDSAWQEILDLGVLAGFTGLFFVALRLTVRGRRR